MNAERNLCIRCGKVWLDSLDLQTCDACSAAAPVAQAGGAVDIVRLAAEVWAFARLEPVTAACEAIEERLRRALASTPPAAPTSDALQPYSWWKWTHHKAGGKYVRYGPATVQTDLPLKDMDEVEFYRGEDGKLWARRAIEFEKRFKRLPIAARSAPAQAVAPTGQPSEMGAIEFNAIIEAIAKRCIGNWAKATIEFRQEIYWLATEFAAALSSSPVAPSEPSDAMDWPLPCDVTVGHGTMRKGVPLRILVLRMKTLYEMATGHNADEVANRTPEQRQALFDASPLNLARIAGRPCSLCDGRGFSGIPGAQCEWCKGTGKALAASAQAEAPVAVEPVAWRFKKEPEHKLWNYSSQDPDEPYIGNPGGWRAGGHWKVIEPLYPAPQAPVQPEALTEAQVEEEYEKACNDWNQATSPYPSVGVFLARRLGVIKPQEGE